MTISQRIAALEESATLQVAALCQQLRSEGVDVIGLSLGEPDFPAPAHVKQAAIDAINNDISHYGPTPGFPALRQAIVDTLNRDIKDYPVRPYNANEIVVSVGAKQALCNAIEALILIVLVGYPELMLIPMPSTIRIVVMTVTLIPLGVVAMMGIDGDSLFQYLGHIIYYFVSRRKLTFRRVGYKYDPAQLRKRKKAKKKARKA